MDNVSLYLPITKVDREQRMVFGYASTPTRDLDGEVIELDAIKDALPDYMQWRNIREMHQPSAVGVTKEANVDEKGLYVGARIVDDDAWKKVIENVYKGFSIGGNVTDRKGSTITGLELVEISLVDRPANPDCKIEMIKVAGMVEHIEEPTARPAFLAPTFALDREEVGLFGRLLAKLAGGAAEKKDKKPYGEADYADPGYQEDGKKRYPIDTEEHIRAAWNYIHQKKNADKYSAKEVTAIKRRIIAAWKRKIDEKGPPEAKVADGDEIPAGHDGFSLPAKAADNDDLAKTILPAEQLACVFDMIREAQRCLLNEEKTEGDGHGKAMAEALCRIARGLASVIGQKAEHESGEAETLRDAADIWSGVDKMAEADLSKRTASGRHHEHIRKAMHHLREAHKALRAGMECCAMAVRGTDEKAADGKVIEAADHIARAVGHFERAAEHHVLAHHHLSAAARGHKGEPSEQPGDAEAGIYKPEEGLTPLGQRHLTEGRVPEYAVDRPYPGKGAAAAVKTEGEIEALIKAARLEGELEALRRQPANPKARLFAVPRGSLPVSEAEEPSAVEKLFKGVNLDAVNPAERQAAGAKLIGNMIANAATFARPVIGDPNFRGGAGR